MKQKIKKILQFLLNPKLLLCIAIAWFITNGWSYVLMGLGLLLEIEWMTIVAGAYLAFLWLPVSPEKLATIAIALWLLKRLFPNDEKTLAVLINLRDKTKKLIKKKKEKRAEKKRKKEAEKQKNKL